MGALELREVAALRQRRAVEPALAVDFRADGGRIDERAHGARRNGHVVEPRERHHAKRVARHLLYRLVARHRRHGQEFNAGAARRKNQRRRIVVARIAVENDSFFGCRRSHFRTPSLLHAFHCFHRPLIARAPQAHRPMPEWRPPRRASSPRAPPPLMPCACRSRSGAPLLADQQRSLQPELRAPRSP